MLIANEIRLEIRLSSLFDFGKGALLLGAVLALSGCATTKTVVPAQPASFSEIKAGSTLVVLPPKLVYESAVSETQLSGTRYDSAAISDDLVRSAAAGLKSVAGEVLDFRSFHSELPDALPLANELGEASDQLLRARVPPELLAKVREYGRHNMDTAVVVQYVRVKVGPGASWDPNTGAIASAINSAYLRAAVMHCGSGRVVWCNQCYLREVPKVNSSKYRQAVESLYQKPVVKK
jgi:hypothetical protein